MHQITVRRGRRLMLALPLVVFAVSPLLAAEVLLYSDQSPGAILLQDAEQQAAVQAGHSVTLVTTPADLLSNLPCEPWQKIVVLYRYTGSEPAFFDDLRSWCTDDRLVRMWCWHDNGTSPVYYSAALGTCGIAVWHQGHTTCAYTCASAPVQTTTALGFFTPTFAGVVPKNPTTVAELLPEQAEQMTLSEIVTALINVVVQDDCLNACRATFVADCIAAINAFTADQGACRSTYANDPAKLASSLQGAANDFSNAVAAALRRYKVCTDGCAGSGSN